MPKLLVPLADGFEDIEAFTIIDVLRRAGINVVTCGLMGNTAVSRSGVKVSADERMLDMEGVLKYDGIVIPGGSQGVENLLKSQNFLRIIDEFGKRGKFLGAICAGPRVLAKVGLLKERRATIADGYERELGMPRSDAVVVDGNIITSQAPGTAFKFSFKIVELFAGKAKAEQLATQMKV